MDKSNKRRVVVTGMGAVSAFGWGIDALAPVFYGETAIKTHRLGELPGASELLAARLETDLPSDMFDRRVQDADRVTQMAIYAAHEAVVLSGISTDSLGMVTWGTSYGGAATMDEAYTRLLFGKNDLAGKVSPLTVPKAMAHASATGVAGWLYLSCPVMTYSCACASSAVAIGEAHLAIQQGRCDVALVGGSEALIVPGVVKAWEALGALAKPDAHEQWKGPFDALRNGLVLGEGAGCMVLESEAHARNRGAQPLAECLGYAQTNDPNCVTQPHVAPQVKTMQQALQSAGVLPGDVAYVNAHATGTRAGDASEILALNEVFKGASPLVSSTKGATGHLMGAAGVLETILSIRACEHGTYPPSVFVSEPEADIRFNLLNKSDQSLGTGIFLTNSFAFGGTNVSLVFRKHQPLRSDHEH
jgi:3-oxoacyl-[acyl-carrier-protein] synthase II